MRSNLQDFIDLLKNMGVLLDLAVVVLGLALLCYVVVAMRRARKAKRNVTLLQQQVASLQREVQNLQGELARAERQVKQEVEQLTGEPPVTPLSPVVEPAPPIPEPTLSITEQATAPAAPVVGSAAGADALELSPMARGMVKSRTSLLGKLKGLFIGRRSVDLSCLDDLEELLISSDVGARVADSLVATVKEHAKEEPEITESALRELLKRGIERELIPVPREHRLYQPIGSPLVVLVVGVNGVGKTTTVAKLATRYKAQGKKVLAIAADTFRAAAVQQLNEWGSRSGFEVYSGADGAKPAAVVFDGMVAAKEQGVDVVLIDTAGRLHTKSNLMQELEGVKNSIKRHVQDAPHETILVVDGVSGQNALLQAREFNSSTPLTGLVVTKLDGTPKGGIIVAISQELKIPVFFVGVGEKALDLIEFSVHDFVHGLLSDTGEGGAKGVELFREEQASRVGNTN